MHRFYVPDLPGEGETCALPEDEARHLARVLRLAAGDEVRVFDGRGREHAAVVQVAAKGRVALRLGGAVAPAPEPAVQITVAAAVLKGDRFDAVIRDVVMLGACRVQPVLAVRGEVPAARARAAHRSGRWQRVAVSSAKQCRRAVVPPVGEPLALDRALQDLPRPVLLLAEPSAEAPAGGIPPRPGEATILIGPEGGWTPAEIGVAQRAGATCVRLGALTLRADSAPLVAMAALLQEWKGWNRHD